MSDGVKKISELVLKEGRALIITDTLSPSELNNVPFGTLFINPSNKTMTVKLPNGIEKFMPNNIFDAKTIDGTMLADNSITADKIKAGEITTGKLVNGSVTEGKINNGAVTTNKLSNNAVVSAKIADGAIITSKIADGAIENSKIADATLTAAKIKSGEINSTLLANGAVTTPKIENGAVTSAKIANGTIEADKIKDEAITSTKIANGAISGSHIADGAVGSTAIADGSITSEKLAENAIQGTALEDGAVSEDKIANGAVTSTKLADKAVTNANIADKAIAVDKLDIDLQNAINNSIKIVTLGNGIAVGYANGKSPKANEQWALSSAPLYVDGDIVAAGGIYGARVYNAVLCDIAEAYIPGEDVEVGDIVAIREDGKIYKATKRDRAIVGVVSENYAMCLGASEDELKAKTKVAVGMIGRVPIKVKGEIRLGDKITIDDNGFGCISIGFDTVVGVAIEDKTEKQDKVLCLIRPAV